MFVKDNSIVVDTQEHEFGPITDSAQHVMNELHSCFKVSDHKDFVWDAMVAFEDFVAKTQGLVWLSGSSPVFEHKYKTYTIYIWGHDAENLINTAPFTYEIVKKQTVFNSENAVRGKAFLDIDDALQAAEIYIDTEYVHTKKKGSANA